jgi:guanylate kinase
LGSSTSRAGTAPSVIVITGPSGAGKGTLIRALLECIPRLEVAVSATTRERREGEVDGVDYHFLSDEEFSQRVDDGDFLEWVPYVSGHRYGTLRSEIARIAAKGRVCVLELETEGALKVKETVPGATTIFITAPIPELERRLRARATESTGEIGERLELARQQLDQQSLFDYVVENNDREGAARRLVDIVHHELNSAATMAP